MKEVGRKKEGGLKKEGRKEGGMKELISKWSISIRCSKICRGYMVRNIKYIS